jgi:flagellar basal body L-ring protein FlgH
MASSVITHEISRQVNQLPFELQQKVLQFAQNLVVNPPKRKGVEGKELIHFAGVIKPDDIHAMSKAIEAGCERT